MDRGSAVVVDLSGTTLAPHVREALRVARSYANAQPRQAGDRVGAKPIGAGDVLRAAVLIAREGRAPAPRGLERASSFAQFADMLPDGIRLPATPSGGLRTSRGTHRWLFRSALGRLIERWLASLPRTANRAHPDLGGLGLVTAAVLAEPDETFADLAREAGTTVTTLREQWHDFLSGTSELTPDWRRLWDAAGSSPPHERVPPRLIDTGWHPLVDGMPPEWASGWGQDRFGVYLEFTLEEVIQRLRWIPPGRFLMGSPTREVGRYEREGPQHEVTIGGGFWLFATPVTQALYEAVTGENPSGFKGVDRPVEQVSWDDAQAFLERLNERVPGLDLVLPSEAQWEYACRAGTTTATYAGDLPDLEPAGARVLDGIAWFDANSGGETHPVALKKPNGWGLYDMLGNVLEWCADHWHGNYEGAPSDGSAGLDENAKDGADRVVRGGSWDGVARHCRAACRYGLGPVVAGDVLGFRPARGQG